MSRLVARAESWERAYDAFQNVNFAAFDYNTVKHSILDYIKLYFPETFNDYIESSEFIAIVEAFAYIAELMAYRIDVNAHENFISTAQRKDSILKLAKLVSYSASRPIPARGLVKITSVTTTESVIDAGGSNLSNRTIRWNDPTNPVWKDQFTILMNRVMQQNFGTVSPSDRFQLQDVLFELYALNLSSLPTGVFQYTAKVNGQSVPMELVPVAYNSDYGITEQRPSKGGMFNVLYGSDGLGDGSDNTGFFCYTKQGQLQKFRTAFDGITPNLTYDVQVKNVNDTDVWVNAIDVATGMTKDEESLLSFRKEGVGGKSGEWTQVDLAHAQNVIFNTNPKRNKYEVETRANNTVRLIFGDGEFAEIPEGEYDIWVRTSLDQDALIPQSSVVNAKASFTYLDLYNRVQTFTFTYSLTGSLQNASAAESMEHVRVTAPAVYYSQDRMVNGQDYNTFMLQDPSILKLRAVNRTFAGDSKYIPWHDASGTYENVKMFGDDGVIYLDDKNETASTPFIAVDTLITSHIFPILASTDIFLHMATRGVPIGEYKKVLSNSERQELTNILTEPARPESISVSMYYNFNTYKWRSQESQVPLSVADLQSGYDPTALITIKEYPGREPLKARYWVSRLGRRIIIQSDSTKFWNTNDGSSVIEYDTLNSTTDVVTILQANVNCNRNNVLAQNWQFNVLGQERYSSGPDTGLPDIHRLSIITPDTDGDSVPDDLNIGSFDVRRGLADIFNPKMEITIPSGMQPTDTGFDIVLPVLYSIPIDQTPGDRTAVTNDVKIEYLDTSGATPIWVRLPAVHGSGWGTSTTNTSYASNTIKLFSSLYTTAAPYTGSGQPLRITVTEYVYSTRADQYSPWMIIPTTPNTINNWVDDQKEGRELWKRAVGRDDLNFAWFHRSSKYHLIDPSASNIIDSFILTKGHFAAIKRWLESSGESKPNAPTSLELRTSYGYLLDNKMISDTIVLHPGKFKILFGKRAPPQLQGSFKVIRSNDRTLTDNQIKTTIVTTVRNFFNISQWEMGETFYFTELAAAIHTALPTEISSVVLVPGLSEHQFGDLFQVIVQEDEVCYPDITVDDIEIVSNYNATNIRLGG